MLAVNIHYPHEKNIPVTIVTIYWTRIVIHQNDSSSMSAEETERQSCGGPRPDQDSRDGVDKLVWQLEKENVMVGIDEAFQEM